MSELLPIQTHPAGDVEIKTKIVCTPNVFRDLISQNGKVFQLSHISYEPMTDSAVLTWVPQSPLPFIVESNETKKGVEVDADSI